MVRKRIRAVFAAALVGRAAHAAHAQYTTDWIANTYGTIASHVGNNAR